ncbi:MAG: outer membrane protein transport protein [Myxococcales bacterium]|nr:outer membrane protein transport protein [Myxococcales bacterium]
MASSPGVAALLFVLLLPLAARANPVEAFGFGARAQGMASAVTAVVNDSTANFYNPAGLAMTDALTIDVGYFFNRLDLRFNGRGQGVDNNSGIQAGILIPGRFGPVRWAFGIAVFLPDRRLSRVRALPQFQPRWVLYDNRTQRIFLTTNIAIRPLKWLSIGGGVTFLTNTSGGVNIAGRIAFPNPTPSQLLTEVDVSLGTLRYPSVGIVVHPIPQLYIGVAYRGEVKLKLDLRATVNGFLTDTAGFKTKIPGSFRLDSVNANLFSPHQVAFGVGWRPIPRLLWTVDVTWLNWSRYPASTADVEVSLNVAGLGDGLLPPKVTVLPPRFHDIVTVRTGLEYELRVNRYIDLLFRAGYAYEPTPAPVQNGDTNYVDNEKHQITLGLGIDINNFSTIMTKPMSFDIAFQLYQLVSRDHRKVDPTDIVGDYRSSGRMYTFSISGSFRF